MGLTMNQKAAIKEAVREGSSVISSIPSPTQIKVVPHAPVVAVLSDELVIEVTGNGGTYSVTLRPAEVSRLRGRYGRGPGFEAWVVARVRDAMISFGGG